MLLLHISISFIIIFFYHVLCSDTNININEKYFKWSYQGLASTVGRLFPFVFYIILLVMTSYIIYNQTVSKTLIEYFNKTLYVITIAYLFTVIVKAFYCLNYKRNMNELIDEIHNQGFDNYIVLYNAWKSENRYKVEWASRYLPSRHNPNMVFNGYNVFDIADVKDKKRIKVSEPFEVKGYKR